MFSGIISGKYFFEMNSCSSIAVPRRGLSLGRLLRLSLCFHFRGHFFGRFFIYFSEVLLKVIHIFGIGLS